MREREREGEGSWMRLTEKRQTVGVPGRSAEKSVAYASRLPPPDGAPPRRRCLRTRALGIEREVPYPSC